MNLFGGTNGIKILENFNIFLNSQRTPINPLDADGFLMVEIKNKPGQEPPVRELQVLFNVETTIPADVFQIIDESRLADLIGKKVQAVASVTYFGLIAPKVKKVAIATGFDNSFNVYEINGE